MTEKINGKRYTGFPGGGGQEDKQPTASARAPFLADLNDKR